MRRKATRARARKARVDAHGVAVSRAVIAPAFRQPPAQNRAEQFLVQSRGQGGGWCSDSPVAVPTMQQGKEFLARRQRHGAQAAGRGEGHGQRGQGNQTQTACGQVIAAMAARATAAHGTSTARRERSLSERVASSGMAGTEAQGADEQHRARLGFVQAAAPG